MKESEKTPYDQSRLKDWLATDSWSAQEAVCLLSDVDPTGAVINWGGFTNTYGGHVDSPKIEHGQLLSEGTDLAFSESADRWLDVTSSYDDEPFIDVNKYVAGSTVEIQRMSLRIMAEHHVRRAWDLYRRNPEHSEDDQRPPCEFIEWGKAQELNIPWFDWADRNNLLETIKTETQVDNDAPEKIAPSSKRLEEGLKAAKMILGQNRASGQLRNWQDFEQCMRKAVVIEHIRENPADFPLCANIEPKNDRRLIKDREPTLTKDFPDFTQTKEIVDEYERLISEK